MEEIKLRLNEKIEIVENNTTFRSTVQDIREDEFLIDVPFSGNKYYLIHIGSEIEFFSLTEKDIIKCKSIVMGKVFENNIQLIIMSNPKVIERIQRREFFRLPISMEAGFYALPEKGIYLNLRDVPGGYFNRLEKVYTLDLSGGGIKILTKQKMMQGQKAIVSLTLSEETILLCSVIRTEIQADGKSYKIALRFEDASERLRDKVIKFIFSKLREKSKLQR